MFDFNGFLHQFCYCFVPPFALIPIFDENAGQNFLTLYNNKLSFSNQHQIPSQSDCSTHNSLLIAKY